ncbi:magnesium and cobalt transport protein CorA|nr:magnesium and cobalt transport protein CorA [Candidatus Pantoea persica]
MTKKLVGWGAILVVPTIIFSMYGMNFKEMPELNSPLGYPLAPGGTVVALFSAVAAAAQVGQAVAPTPRRCVALRFTPR